MNGEATLYVWGSYLMGIAMMVTELLLLYLRERAINGQFGRRRESPDHGGGAAGDASTDGPASR